MLTKRPRPGVTFKDIKGATLSRRSRGRRRDLLPPISGPVRAKSDADGFRAEAPRVPTVGSRSSQISDKLQVEQTRRVSRRGALRWREPAASLQLSH